MSDSRRDRPADGDGTEPGEWPDEWLDVDAGSREHYQDADLYDYEYRRRRADIALYKQVAATLAPQGGPILDLACGSGRLAIPLARAGYQVVGLDSSAPMLERAAARLARQSRAVRERVSLIPGDMRQFALGRQFSLVISAFNSFEHLYTRVELEAALACVRHHLSPGGHLVFDVQNPDLHWLSQNPDRRWAGARFTHPGTGQRYIYSTSHRYEPVSQILLARLYYQALDDTGENTGEERVVRLSQRKFFPAELEALMHANGFSVSRRLGDFDGGELHGDSEVQMLVCRSNQMASGGEMANGGESDVEIVAAIGLQRDDEYMYYVKGTALWRMPFGQRECAEPIVQLDIDERDADQVYFLDQRGHVVRIPRTPRS